MRLDIHVNNAAAVIVPSHPLRFWESTLEVADLLHTGLLSHYVAAVHAAPLLIAAAEKSGRSLLVSTGHYGAVSYHQGSVCGAQKVGSDKMIADMARELRPTGVSAVSIWMGGVNTERAPAAQEALAPADRSDEKRESAEFAGRVIWNLYQSELLPSLSGRSLIGAELGARLGVTDVDGSRPLSHRFRLGGPPELHPSLLPDH